MTERKLFQKVITEERIANSIRAGCQTSTEIAKKMKVHPVSIQKKLLEMYEAGYLTRKKLGQTFVYAIAKDAVIPVDTTEKDRRALARAIKAAKRK